MAEKTAQELAREDIKRRYPAHAEQVDKRQQIEQDRNSSDPAIQGRADVERRHGKTKGAN